MFNHVRLAKRLVWEVSPRPLLKAMAFGVKGFARSGVSIVVSNRAGSFPRS